MKIVNNGIAQAGNKFRVLVVDDSKPLRLYARKVLEKTA